jgi:hypothetical protein
MIGLSPIILSVLSNYVPDVLEILESYSFSRSEDEVSVAIDARIVGREHVVTPRVNDHIELLSSRLRSRTGIHNGIYSARADLDLLLLFR